MVESAIYMGTDNKTAESKMKDVLDFEIKLAGITQQKENRRNKTALNNKMILAEVAELYDLNWVDFINDMLENPTNENQVNIKIPLMLTMIFLSVKKMKSSGIIIFKLGEHY